VCHIFSTTLVWNTFLSNKYLWSYDQDTHVILRVKCPLLLSDFNQNWNIPTDFNETHQFQNSWKSIQKFSCCLMHTVGWRKFNRHPARMKMYLKTQNIGFLGWDSNLGPPEYKVEVVTIWTTSHKMLHHCHPIAF
jgi:hypothetical protein